MKDLGQLHHFLGVTVEPRLSGLLLHQRQYALDILERAGMTDCKPCSTPVDTQAKLSKDMGSPVADANRLPESCWCLAVPHFHQVGPHICHSAGLPSYA